MADLACMYGFGASPTTRIVEIAMEHQTLQQSLPKSKFNYQNNNAMMNEITKFYDEYYIKPNIWGKILPVYEYYI